MYLSSLNKKYWIEFRLKPGKGRLKGRERATSSCYMTHSLFNGSRMDGSKDQKKKKKDWLKWPGHMQLG